MMTSALQRTERDWTLRKERPLLSASAYLLYGWRIFARVALLAWHDKMSDDKKKLTVQFFWQPQYSHGNRDPVDLLEEPLSSRDLRFTEKEGIEYFLARRQDDGSYRGVESGDIFTFITDDPA